MEDKPVAPPLELTFAFDNESFSDAELHIVEEDSACARQALPPEVLRVIDMVRPPVEEQRTVISDLLREKWSKGQAAYVVSTSWWKAFKLHVQLVEEPGMTTSQLEEKDGSQGPVEATDSSEEGGIESPQDVPATDAGADRESEVSNGAFNESKQGDADSSDGETKEDGGSAFDVAKTGFDSDLIPIDNSSLQGKYPHELRPDLVRGFDYVLVSSDVWHHLHTWYGGGPRFSRIVESLNDNKRPNVCMYPTFLRCCWTDANGEPSMENADLLSVPSSLLPDKLISLYRRASRKEDQQAASIRAWHRVVENQGSSSPSDGTHAAAASSSDSWRLMMPTESAQSFEDLKWQHGDVIMLEERPRLHDDASSFGPWKRFAALHEWDGFEVGDIIDAQDCVNKWYEAEILDMDDTRLKVHYIGWSSRWDEWVPRDPKAKRIAARGTHTSGPFKKGSYEKETSGERNRIFIDGLAKLQGQKHDLSTSNIEDTELSLSAEEPEKKASVRISKAVLSASSEYFRRMFTTGMREAAESRAVVKVGPGQTAACVDVIRSVYTNSVESTDPSHLFSVILLADRLSLEHVANIACWQVAGLKGPDVNVCEALLSLPESISKAKWFGVARHRLELALLSDFRNAQEMTKRSTTKRLSIRTLHMLLSSDNLGVSSENNCLLLVLDWMSFHRDTEAAKDPENIKMLWSALRLGCMDSAYVANVVRHIKLGDASIGVDSSVLQEALIYHSMSVSQRRAFCEDFDDSNKALYRSRGDKKSAAFVEWMRFLPRHPVDEMHPYFTRVAIHGDYDHFRYSDLKVRRGFIMAYCLHWNEEEDTFKIRVLVKLSNKPTDFGVPYLCGRIEACVDHTEFDADSGAAVGENVKSFYNKETEFNATFDLAEFAFVIASHEFEKCEDFDVDRVRVTCNVKL